MPVAACPAPRAYLQEYLLPTARPGARNLKIENVGRADGLVRAYRARMKAMAIPMEVGFDGCTMTVSYEEKGVRYRERFLTLIENRGQLAGGQWANRETMSVRAPAEEFEQWEPVFQMICGSVQLSPRWIQGEIRGQQQRVNTMRRVELTVQEIDRQILSHQRAANAEIQNDMYLTLTEQEEYVNPYTGEVERGTDQLGPHRWVTEGGDVLFAPEEGFDPNVRPELNRVDWKRTPRARFPFS
jgi:hypothetical protein